MRALLSWMGAADIQAARDEKKRPGPLARAVIELDLDCVMIFSNYPEQESNDVVNWIKELCPDKTKAHLSSHSLNSPMDFNEVNNAAMEGLDWLLSNYGPKLKLIYHLGPGTFAMQLVWVLISQNRNPGTLITTSREQGLKEVDLPYEVSAEFIGNLLRPHDRKLDEISQAKPPISPAFENIIHRSPQMRSMIELAQKAAKRNVSFLIMGDSGTGKELFARAIHQASLRGGQLISLNCGAIPPTLVESELFGHKKGAFTGAVYEKKGIFELASFGTVFLDEIGELSLDAQVKILRVLEEGKILPVGATEKKEVDVRLITATNRDLIEEVSRGNFREDLFYRLAVAVLKIPPLREREGDLGLLIDHFISEKNKELFNQPDFKPKKLTPGARRVLMQHSWPGNVRELQNALTRALIWSEKDKIDKKDIENAILKIPKQEEDNLLDLPLGGDFQLEELIQEVQKRYIRKALEQAGENKSKAARLLGYKTPQNFYNLLKKLGFK